VSAPTCPVFLFEGDGGANTGQNVDQSTRNAPITDGITAGRRISHGTRPGPDTRLEYAR